MKTLNAEEFLGKELVRLLNDQEATLAELTRLDADVSLWRCRNIAADVPCLKHVQTPLCMP